MKSTNQKMKIRKKTRYEMRYETTHFDMNCRKSPKIRSIKNEQQ